MTVNISGNIETNYVNIATTTPTEIQPVFQGRAMVIASIKVTEAAGGTPNLTIDAFDGTTAYFIRNAKPMLARETITEDELWLPNGWKLRVTLNVGSVSVRVNYFNPNAASRNAGQLA